MTATNPRARFMPLLGAGLAVGAILALVTSRPGGRSLTPFVAALPFLLAALTGVAKTTTA
jgi:hypothetical protein